jgi:thiol-disulfide isomerase/thioredoxin
LYYSQWCGHCKNFKPIWDEFCKTNTNTNVSTHSVDCENNQCPDYIKGYPTVMLYKQNGQKITFSGQRTVEELRKFISN